MEVVKKDTRNKNDNSPTRTKTPLERVKEAENEGWREGERDGRRKKKKTERLIVLNSLAD